MGKYFLNIIIGYLIAAFCLCFIFGVSYASDGNIKAELVWSEFGGENNEIYYSHLKDNIWTQKVQLSNNGFRNISPSISSGTDGITWVVWTAISGSKNHLLFSNCDGKTWSSPTQISTNLSSNTAPSIVVDNENTPWIVWAGFDGQDDDIFFTRWNGFDWDASQRVNKDNSLPDILPIIGIDEDGMPWVEWSGYDGGKYRNYSSRYTGSEWDEEIEAESSNLYESIPGLPDFLNDSGTASIHIKDGREIQSIPLKEIITESVSSDDLDMDSVQVLRQDSNDKLYLAFGDSITRGVVRSDGTTAEGYEIELEAFIDANLWASQVLNSGKSGERTSDGVNRLVEILNTYSLDYALLLEGTNDILNGVSYETTLYNLGIMVDYCISYNVIPIIATLPPIKKGSNKGGYVDEIPNVYNPGIKEIASGRGIEVSDQYAEFDGQWNRYSDDYIHPNEAGYSVMAQTWYNSIPKEEEEEEEEEEEKASSGGGGCFIATAAYGSSLEPNVIVLKEFRDKYLMVRGWGKRFVEFYYRTSPLIANIIANNESLKFVVRTCLYPLVGFSYLMLNSSLEQRFFVFGISALFVIGIGLFFVRIRLRGRIRQYVAVHRFRVQRSGLRTKMALEAQRPR